MICYDCGTEYRWVYKDGKLRPLNSADDLPHWRTCRGFRVKSRQRWKARKKAKAAKSARKDQEVKPVKITGDDFREPCQHCTLPPWEQCQDKECLEQKLLLGEQA